jgi:hypothetical protein
MIGDPQGRRWDLMAANGQVTRRRRPTVTMVAVDLPAAERQPSRPAGKPTPESFGVDLAALDWQRSGTGAGSFEVAFVASAAKNGDEAAGQMAGEQRRPVDWVLLRVADDPDGRILVYDRNEWICFLDGAGQGEFDWPPKLIRPRAS